jgi:hypothetical protein
VRITDFFGAHAAAFRESCGTGEAGLLAVRSRSTGARRRSSQLLSNSDERDVVARGGFERATTLFPLGVSTATLSKMNDARVVASQQIATL